jgi:hypothetical protein
MKSRSLILISSVVALAASCSSLDYSENDMRRMISGATPSASLMSSMRAQPDSARGFLPREGRDPVPELEDDEQQEAQAGNGTDPRDFAPKFMPYFRYTELENGVTENNMALFGLIAFNKSFAATYEFPIALEREAPNGGLGPPLNPNDQIGEETGIGDLNIRFMYRNPSIALGPVEILPICELWFPTASEDVLGANLFQVAPGFAAVMDLGFWPHSFMALMNFYQFDVYGDDDAPDVSFYKGRWFFMFPFPTMTYLLPEMQPIYDFETDEFSFWIGPELGQIVGEGKVLYLKPGWGIDNDLGTDRDFTFEFGWRWFF